MAIKMLFFDYRKSEENFFKKNNLEHFDITFFKESLDIHTLKNLSEQQKQETTVISVFVNSRVTQEVLKEFPNLMIITTRSTGFNHININTCRELNIRVINVQNYGATAVTQYTFGLILSLVRNIYPAYESLMRNKQENEEIFIGRDLNNLTLGIIGTGAIGSGLCKIAHAFDMQILANDIIERESLETKYGVKYVSREELYQNSNIITLNLPYREEHKYMISEKEFNLMQKDCWLINVSRGELIDTKALYNAIMNKKITGCALDVIECESLSFNSDDFISKIDDFNSDCLQKTILIQKLIEQPNVIITPHIAYLTRDAVDYILKTTFDSIMDNFKGGTSNQV